jgi:multiple sugar transport system substrate-binding protein
MSTKVSRRAMLRALGIGSAGAALAACAPAAPQVIKETVVVKEEVPVKETVVVTEQVTVKETVVAVPAPAYEKGELNVLVCCYAPPDLEIRNKTNADFQAANPDLTINQELLPAGQNYFEKLQTLIAAGTPPDAFDMWEGYVQPYAENGALMNLDPFLETDPKIKKSDFVPVAINGGSWKDNLYAFLIGFIPGPVSLYYNVDHFDKAGIAKPSSDWKWDDLRAAAKALVVDENSDGMLERWGLVFDLWFVMWLYWVWSNGGDAFNADQTKCALTDPTCTEALQYWADLSLVDKTTIPSSELAAMQGSVNAFQTGQVSMYLGNAWDMGTLKAAQNLNWGAVLSPKANDGNRIWYTHFQCWSISPQTKMPKAAWTYIRDFTLQYAVDVMTAFPQIPSLKQLLYAFSNEITISLGWDQLISLATQPDILRIPGAGAKWDKISQIIQAELDLAFVGEKTCAEAAAAACPKVDEELART